MSQLVCEQMLMSECEQGGFGWVGAVQYLASQEEDPRGRHFSLHQASRLWPFAVGQNREEWWARGEKGS